MFQSIGYLVIFLILGKCLFWVFKLLQCYSWVSKPIDFKQFGDWVVITGGTDGIGAEYVKQLAKGGLDIIVVGRNPEKLKSIQQYVFDIGRKCETVQADLSIQKEIQHAAVQLEKICREKTVGVLVNNAGISYSHPDFYHLLDAQDLDHMVNVNCSAMIFLTAAVVGSMESRKTGLIINISSDFGRLPAPLVSLYGATKAFVIHFSKCIRYEYAPSNIHVQCICPQVVCTKMSKVKRSSFLIPTAEKFVQHALCTVTRLKECNGYLGHEIQSAVARLLPESILNNFIFKSTKRLREKALRKK